MISCDIFWMGRRFKERNTRCHLVAAVKLLKYFDSRKSPLACFPDMRVKKKRWLFDEPSLRVRP